MVGLDIPIPEIQTSIHPPTIKEIALMGEQDFFMAMQYLCVDKESLIQDETLLATLTNFQVLMKVLEQSQDKQKKVIIQTLLLLLFPSYTALILPASIILSGKDKSPITIDDNNFEIIQEYIKQVLCANSMFQGDNIVYNPANEAAKKIADKIMAGRRKVAQLKGGNNNESVLTRYLSILTIGTNTLSLEQCTNLTLFQLFDIMERYTAFVEWDTDLRVRLAGGKPDKTVETWMRDMHTMNKKKPDSTPQKGSASSNGAAFRSGKGWVNT